MTHEVSRLLEKLRARPGINAVLVKHTTEQRCKWGSEGTFHAPVWVGFVYSRMLSTTAQNHLQYISYITYEAILTVNAAVVGVGTDKHTCMWATSVFVCVIRRSDENRSVSTSAIAGVAQCTGEWA